MSCGQPIAPMLEQQIQPMEWESLDPDKYPYMFSSLIKRKHFIKGDLPQPLLDRYLDNVKKGRIVFRRLSAGLRGFPSSKEKDSGALQEQEFSIIQFGDNISNLDLDSAHGCSNKLGRIMSSYSDQDALDMYVVPKDIGHASFLYFQLFDWRGRSGQNLWRIHGRIYGEFYDEKGDVQLSELRVSYPIHLEPVCLYHYKKSSRKY